MRYYFDSKKKITAKMLEPSIAYDSVNEELYEINEDYKQEHLVEILKSSHEMLEPNLKKWYNVNNEFAFELTAPILKQINEELKKYGL
jgi:hypothetical protein